MDPESNLLARYSGRGLRRGPFFCPPEQIAMNTIDIKTIVSSALSREWRAFELDHRPLAAVLDQSLMVEQATKSLADDPEYQEVIPRAQAEGFAANVITDAIAGY